MKIQFLGTAAAEGVPSLFCACKICQYAWKVGGHEIRNRCSAVIDDILRLDFGPDTFRQMLQFHQDLSKTRSVLITHTHSDHLSVGDIYCRRRGMANLPDDIRPITVYGNDALRDRLADTLNDTVQWKKMIPFLPAEIDGYRVTALEAVHCLSDAPNASHPVVFDANCRADGEHAPLYRKYTRSEEALFYLIEKDGKSILYAHDTDCFTPSDMDFLAGRHIDLISLDCTNAARHAQYIGHMSAYDNLAMRDALIRIGAADSHTIFVANHFSHNGLVPEAEMQTLMPNFLIAYDGLCVSV